MPGTTLGNTDLIVESNESLIAEYRRIRLVLSDIQNELVTLQDPATFEKMARELGVMHGKALVLDSEDALGVIADHCIYANPTLRRKLLAKYRRKHEGSLDPDRQELLNSMDQARYMLLYCHEAVDGLGAQVQDLLSEESFLLVDIHLSATV